MQNSLSQIPLRHFVAIALLILAACANPVAPTGGPRDTAPPVILRSDPENASVNFNAGEIRISFDEFIQLKGLSQQFLSSPPFKKVPETRMRGKTLTIKLAEELRENTTYTLFFGNAIADFNEGNAIPNFRFIFSTGPVLDSMELNGRVINAKTLAPEKDVFVMLYDFYEDSIPMLERPYYISRTGEKGDFLFTNLRNIPYKIFALRDVNANLIYDQPNEEIAFLPHLVHPHAPATKRKTETINETDTLAPAGVQIPETDTIAAKLPPKGLGQEPYIFGDQEEYETIITEPDILTDTVSAEDIIIVTDSLEIDKPQKGLTLYLFNEVDSTQRLVRSEYLHPNRLQFVFRHPVQELTINALPPFEDSWKIMEISSKSDTVVCWLLAIDRDSLVLEVSAAKMKTDTVKLSLARLQTYRTEKLSDTTLLPLEVKTNIPRTGPANVHEPVILTFAEPLAIINFEKIELLEDSVKVEPEIKFSNEAQRIVIIDYAWKDTTRYDLLVADSAFFGIYDHFNDTLQSGFKTRMRSDYGNLKLNIEHSSETGQFIVDLLDEKGASLKQKITSLEQTQIEFPYLLPGKYQVKLVHDINLNGQWDTGGYLAGKQPEQVYIYDKTIEIRANWDIEETFIIPGN